MSKTMNKPVGLHIKAGRFLLALVLCGLCGFGFAAEQLKVKVLTPDLGDPRTPYNCKLSFPVPESMKHRSRPVTKTNFQVYVIPQGSSDEEGAIVENRATGIMPWRRGDTLFLDVRRPPSQEKSGSFSLLVRCLDDNGKTLAAGRAADRVCYRSASVDVILVIDSSQSMIRSDRDRKRVEAARAFIDLASKAGRVSSIGIVSFSNRAEVLAPLTPVSEREKLVKALKGVRNSGQTNMDRALASAEWTLEKGNAERSAIVFLTDGHNEPGRYKNTHRRFTRKEIPIFAIGLSGNADHEVLQRMAAETGGKAFRAASDKELMAIYLRIAAEIGRKIMLFTKSIPGGGPQSKFTVPIDRSLRDVNFFLDTGGAPAALQLETPDGVKLGKSAASVNYLEDKAFRMARVEKPKSGAWNLRLKTTQSGQTYHLAVSADTDFFLDLFPVELKGRRLLVGATLARGAEPVVGERVRLLPDPVRGVPGVDLVDDGQHGDGQAGDGVYAGVAEISPDTFGDVALRLRAWGMTWEKERFVRQTGWLVQGIEKLPPKVEDVVVTCIKAGRIDLGTRLPGEKASACSPLTLVADEPQAVDVVFTGLARTGGIKMPAESIRISPDSGKVLQPGTTKLAVELNIPDDIPSGQYSGMVRISAGDIVASAAVEVLVPHIDLGFDTGVLDFGEVYAGQIVSKKLHVGLDSPRAMKFNWAIGDKVRKYVRFECGRGSRLEAGPDNKLPVVLNVPSDMRPGVREDDIILSCGSVEKKLRVRFTIPHPHEDIPEPLFVVDISQKDKARPNEEKAKSEKPVSPKQQPEKVAKKPDADKKNSASDNADKLTGRASKVAATASKISDAEIVWQQIRPYLFWALVAIILVLICLVLVLRVVVRHRMARFALGSVLAHVIVVLIAANYFIIVEPTALMKKPMMVARLVKMKSDLGFSLSEAEKQVLKKTKISKKPETRFKGEKKVAAKTSRQQRKTKVEKKSIARSMAYVDIRDRIHDRPTRLSRDEFKAARTFSKPKMARKLEAPVREPRKRKVAKQAPVENTKEFSNAVRLVKQEKVATRIAKRSVMARPSSSAVSSMRKPVLCRMSKSDNSLSVSHRPLMSMKRSVAARRVTSEPDSVPSVDIRQSQASTTSVRAAKVSAPKAESVENDSAVDSSLKQATVQPKVAAVMTRSYRPSKVSPLIKRLGARPQESLPFRPSEKLGRRSAMPARLASPNPQSAPRPMIVKKESKAKSARMAAASVVEKTIEVARADTSHSLKTTPERKLKKMEYKNTGMPSSSRPDMSRSLKRQAHVDMPQSRHLPEGLKRSVSFAKSLKQPEMKPSSELASRLARREGRKTERKKPSIRKRETEAESGRDLLAAVKRDSLINKLDKSLGDMMHSLPIPDRSGVDKMIGRESEKAGREILPRAMSAGRETIEEDLLTRRPGMKFTRRGEELVKAPSGASDKEISLDADDLLRRGRGSGRKLSDISGGLGAGGDVEFDLPRIGGGRAMRKPVYDNPVSGEDGVASAKSLSKNALPRRLDLGQRVSPMENRSADTAAMKAGLNTEVEVGTLSMVLGAVRCGAGSMITSGALERMVGTYRKRLARGMAVDKRVVALDVRQISDCQMLFMPGRGEVSFSADEVRSLRSYLAAGGAVWIDDCSLPGDNRFDISLRREMAKVLPLSLSKLPAAHPALRSVYDLASSMPFGSNGRNGLPEGIECDGKLCVLYTRNAYGVGMASPRASVDSGVPDAEVHEGSLRMAMNTVTYFLGGEASRTWAGETTSAQAEGQIISWQDFTGLTQETLGWTAEPWGNPAKVGLAPDGRGGDALKVDLLPGKKSKAAIKYDIPASMNRRIDLTNEKAIVADLYNGGNADMKVSLVFTCLGGDNRWHQYESRGVYLRTGWNRGISFNLTGKSFRSRLTGWKEYDSNLENKTHCARISVFIYNSTQSSCVLLLDNLCFAR